MYVVRCVDYNNERERWFGPFKSFKKARKFEHKFVLSMIDGDASDFEVWIQLLHNPNSVKRP